ncbi:hypothetical protein PHYSODRAFT_320620 [Phytophthora sojae]|uniref:Uncharacterized protein n=1 Tax=Phytophthora sojae (strain P6497) TaxID=1094619 RepID=G4YLU5_PHYSP|nr:hypothetical protein PHYSODRAFT_320620 [Phytophthora sojae]EGZ26715.1 hypothetical protein PHYSODRAFT_320620 [Phytophthora sojae]|eukprot:XP_009513990.1 hypothetical protein PHYSODRAFT_320620 [Phytophthora sojae]
MHAAVKSSLPVRPSLSKSSVVGVVTRSAPLDSLSVVYPPDDHVPHNRRNSAFVVDNAPPTLLTALPPGVAVNHVQLRDAEIPLQDPEMERRRRHWTTAH